MNDLMKQMSGASYSISDVVVLRCPNDIDELEKYLKEAMSRNRILRISIGTYSNVPVWHQTFVEYITKLALKYKPWQFHWLCQEDGAIEIKWIEVDEWLYKYKD